MNTFWRVDTYINEYKRYRLMILSPNSNSEVYKESPYFIAREKYYRSLPGKYRLLGSGMSPSGCAADLGWFNKLAEAKAEAIRMAKESVT